MPDRIHDTTTTTLAQTEACQQDDWSQEVVPRLPVGVQQQAVALKAFERSRQICCATDLLRGLLAYVYTVHSFQHLSMWSALLGMADVSAPDSPKRSQRPSTYLP